MTLLELLVRWVPGSTIGWCIPIDARGWVAPGKRRIGALEGHIFFNWDSSFL